MQFDDNIETKISTGNASTLDDFSTTNTQKYLKEQNLEVNLYWHNIQYSFDTTYKLPTTFFVDSVKCKADKTITGSPDFISRAFIVKCCVKSFIIYDKNKKQFYALLYPMEWNNSALKDLLLLHYEETYLINSIREIYRATLNVILGGKNVSFIAINDLNDLDDFSILDTAEAEVDAECVQRYIAFLSAESDLQNWEYWYGVTMGEIEYEPLVAGEENMPNMPNMPNMSNMPNMPGDMPNVPGESCEESDDGFYISDINEIEGNYDLFGGFWVGWGEKYS